MRFAELCQFRALAGLTATVAAVAETEGVSVSEYLRRLVLDHLAKRSTERQRPHDPAMSVYDGPRGLVVA